MTEFDDFQDIFMARRVTVCAGAILKEFEKNSPYRKILSVEHVRHNILISVDTLSNTTKSEKTNKLGNPERDVH